MSTVELTRTTDGPALVAALAEHGLTGTVEGGDGALAVHVEDCDESQLAHALEDWIRGLDVPLVPVRIDDCTFAVQPPAA